MSKVDRILLSTVSLLLMLTLIAWFFAISVQSEFEVIFLDVGQGDATLFSFRDGSRMLVDCGRDRVVLQGLGRSLPFFERTIDILAVTHPDVDHFGGCIDVLERFDVGQVWISSTDGDDKQWDEFLALAHEPTIIKEPQERIFGGATVSILYPDIDITASSTIKSNNKSLVLRVQADFSVLLTGDAEVSLEEYLSTTYGSKMHSDILQVGHHGSNTSSIEPFIEVVSPEISVVSAGKNNRYGHPTKRVLARLKRASSTIFRTDQQGDIICKIEDSDKPACVARKNLIY